MATCTDKFFGHLQVLPMPEPRPSFVLPEDTHLHMEVRDDWPKPIPTGCNGAVIEEVSSTTIPEAIVARPPLFAFMFDFVYQLDVAAHVAEALYLHANKVKAMEESHALLLAFAEEMRSVLSKDRMDTMSSTSTTYRLLNEASTAIEAGRASMALAKALANQSARDNECAFCGGPACQNGKWNGLSTPCPSDCCEKHTHLSVN